MAEAFGTTDDDDSTKIEITVETLNRLLTQLVGDYLDHVYLTYDTKTNDQRNSPMLNSANEEKAANKNKDLTYEWKNEIAIRDLFIWAILTNQIELAKVFLPFMKYRICAALIASKILLMYSKLERKLDRQENYLKNANYFEEYAVACIDLCDKADDVKATEIVLQRIDLFGGVTCLEVIHYCSSY